MQADSSLPQVVLSKEDEERADRFKQLMEENDERHGQSESPPTVSISLAGDIGVDSREPSPPADFDFQEDAENGGESAGQSPKKKKKRKRKKKKKKDKSDAASSIASDESDGMQAEEISARCERSSHSKENGLPAMAVTPVQLVPEEVTPGSIPSVTATRVVQRFSEDVAEVRYPPTLTCFQVDPEKNMARRAVFMSLYSWMKDFCTERHKLEDDSEFKAWVLSPDQFARNAQMCSGLATIWPEIILEPRDWSDGKNAMTPILEDAFNLSDGANGGMKRAKWLAGRISDFVKTPTGEECKGQSLKDLVGFLDAFILDGRRSDWLRIQLVDSVKKHGLETSQIIMNGAIRDELHEMMLGMLGFGEQFQNGGTLLSFFGRRPLQKMTTRERLQFTNSRDRIIDLAAPGEILAS